MHDRLIAFSALLGLVAGIGHGILSHHAELPISLSEQFLQSMQIGERSGFR
ncbi:MAG: hypothetical protein AAFY11_00120 [Cyanobacteria bacterium J06641_5]